MKIFEKRNETEFKDALLKEVDGLKELSFALEFQDQLLVPKVYNVDEKTLHIEKINSTISSDKNSSLLGKMLAKMHKKVYKQYGYDQDNYIGLNPQKNRLSDNWGNFFVEYRLRYQLSLIKDSSVKKRFTKTLDQNQEKLEKFLNNHTKHPSILHGDLWSGNVLYSCDKVYLIDPAVYYGDREVDLAMTQMFGGFDKAFYDAYEEEYPLCVEYGRKKVIYNLYHYLNHYNLFGRGYLGGCEDGFELVEKL
jgi:fructosamine-3-kinase